MAWEHVVGRVPFHDSEAPMVILTRQLNEEIPAAMSVNPDVDPDLSDWIDKLLVKDPVKRAQSPARVWDDLEEIIMQPARPPVAPRGSAPEPEPGVRHPAPADAGAVREFAGPHPEARAGARAGAAGAE